MNVPIRPDHVRISVNGIDISLGDQLWDSKSQLSGLAYYDKRGKFIEYACTFALLIFVCLECIWYE